MEEIGLARPKVQIAHSKLQYFVETYSDDEWHLNMP